MDRMSLDEEKCRDSLSNLNYVLQGNRCDGCIHNESEFCKKCNVKEDLSVMRKLIHEHYDNTPLKFEELEVGMWVWDNKNHSWLKVIGFYGFNIHVQFGIGIHKNDCYVEFEENRFYKKQVK